MYIKKSSQFAYLIIFLSILFFANFVKAQSNDDCLMCHSDNTLTTEKNGKTISLYVNVAILQKSPHAKLNCVSCHVGFDPEEMPHKENIEPVQCVNCHKDAPVKHQFHPQILKTQGKGLKPGENCKDCHGTHNIISPEKKESPFNVANIVNGCGRCHKKEKDNFIKSAHYVAYKNKLKGAPNCLICHDTPITDITVKRDPLQVKISQEKLCLSCHLDNPDVRKRIAPTTAFIKSYENSVHGQALNNGNVKAANCVDCHTAHEMQKSTNPTSTVFKTNVPNTCGKCHGSIEKVYLQSIHGKALANGNPDAPVCITCHGEHNILAPNNPNSLVSAQNVSSKVCTPCHSSVRLSEKYGFSPNQPITFKDSFHGLALEGGYTTVANCASCHTAHNIKPPSDPTSSVYKGNLVKTCGKCHPGANANFTKGNVHVIKTEKKAPILYWISSLYVSLIIIVIGFMFLHNFLDFIKKAKIKKMKQRGLIKEEVHSHSLYLRMTLSERIQHVTLMLSFFALVITGFMLRFPDTWWVRHLRDLSEYGFQIRGIIHRVAAVAMVAVSLYHIYYISFTKRGKQLIKDLLPKYSDIIDALGIAKYNLGISKTKPKLGRFSYVEKAEYWALIWGTIIMTITGIIMWFDNTFIGMLTKLGYDIANTIHYYEAWLAFLAIVVWHFYFVIFNPDVYPMSLAWIKGTITEEEMAEEHPAELEKIKKENQDQNNKEQ